MLHHDINNQMTAGRPPRMREHKGAVMGIKHQPCP